MVRVTEKMLEAAADAIGDEVDDDRIEEALENVAALDIHDVKEARSQLRVSEQMFDAAGGRGVSLAEKIDNLRIYCAVKELIPKPKEFKVVVTVRGYEDQSPHDVKKMVQFLMEAGLHTASDCQEDWGNDFERDSAELELCSVANG